ncbi:MAG: polysaccharide deacetylase family protein [bacterium]
MMGVIRQMKHLAKQGVIRPLKHLAKQIVPLPLGVALLYHRVADLETDPQLLSVSPRNFAEHLEVLRRSYLPVRLGELCHRSLNSPLRTRLIAFTFDDGYADNLHQALPLLQAAAIPATVFVTAGQVGQKEEFWWDELERILLGIPDLPEWLEVTIGSKSFCWHLPSAGDKLDRHWHVLSDQPCSPRQTAYRELCNLLRPLSTPTRKYVLDWLRTWAGVNGLSRPHNRVLTEDELVALVKDGLVEVGAHTMTHPVLAAQPVAVQRQEIETSKRKLEDLLTEPVRYFSYPFGGHHDYTADTVKLVQEAGYACACSNFPGTVHWGTHRYEIPRFIVRDWNGDELCY